MQIYSASAGNEIYRVQVKESKIFAEFEGVSFSETAFHCLNKNVALLGVKATGSKTDHGVVLNPGPNRILV